MSLWYKVNAGNIEARNFPQLVYLRGLFLTYGVQNISCIVPPCLHYAATMSLKLINNSAYITSTQMSEQVSYSLKLYDW